MDLLAVGVIGFCLGVLLTALAAGLSSEVGKMRRQSKELKAMVADLEGKIGEMGEQLKHVRFTHRTVAGLEDATAVLIDAELEVDALMGRLRTVHRILGKTREGPESYENCEWREKAG